MEMSPGMLNPTYLLSLKLKMILASIPVVPSDEDRRTQKDVKGPSSAAVRVGHRYSLRSTTIKDEHAVLNGKRLVDSDENQEHLMMSSACGKPLMSASQKK